MWSYRFVGLVVFVCCFLLLLLLGCAPEQETVAPATRPRATASATPAAAVTPVATAPTAPATATAAVPTATAIEAIPTAEPTNQPTSTSLTPPTPTPPPSLETGAAAAVRPSGPAVVAFIEGDDIKVWDEASGQSKTIFSAGGVAGVWMSDDGQLVAFFRRWIDFNWCEQVALWVVGRNGENPRELVSPDALRQHLDATECEYPAVTVHQVEWLPQTHRLVYSMIVDVSHAGPQGVYLVDADTLSAAVLAPADYSLNFVPSPDGRQIALMSYTGLSFINADGSNWRQDVLTYPLAGVPIPILPTGVWTEDGRAFLITAPTESESEFELNFTVWRVPVDGSPAQPLATPTNTGVQPLDPQDWVTTSPAGVAFLVSKGTLVQLCPDATDSSQVCGAPVNLGSTIAGINWLDSARFLFLTREPQTLFLGSLDGTNVPIVTWVDEPAKFAAVLLGCVSDSEFLMDVNVPDGTHFAPGAAFTKTWRLRNSGSCTWDASYRLNFISGEQMNGPESMALGETVPPGAEVDISIELVAPQADGRYRGQWQLVAPDGTGFGARPYLEIVVP